MIAGFSVLSLVTVLTYTNAPPIPVQAVDASGTVVFTGANHAHAAMFGVFGMLALAVMVFCLRAMQSDEVWKETEKFVRFGFWGANVGLALMIVLDLFPGGVLQLWDSIANGYWHARRLTFIMGGAYHKLEWLRMVGDMIFLFAGALPITLGALRSLWKRDLTPAP
jgi:nitric oxide reductase subunit B